jgi:hypothetical protein
VNSNLRRIGRRPGLWVLLALALGVLLVGYRERATVAAAVVGRAPAPARGAELDWTRVSERDLDIASVFLVTRERGVRAGLDSLERLMARDSALAPRGHTLAHAMGRYAMARRNDLAVLGECTPSFQSGCFHGVMEGYFLQGGTVDPSSIARVCASTAGRSVRGFELRECWHGLGHGLMVNFDGDARQALPLCDALQRAEAQRECQDGVFMELTLRAVGVQAVNVGDGPAMPQTHAHGADAHAGGHAGGEHGAPAGAARAPERTDPAQLCGGFDERYQPACWLYQPPVLIAREGMRPDRVLRACDAAPTVAVDDCYRGFGKQYLSALRGNVGAMIPACAQGSAAHATDCLLGGVEYLTDLSWDVAPGIALCRQVPGASKPRCYALIGERIALLHADPAAVTAACQAVEPAYVSACLAAARATSSA